MVAGGARNQRRNADTKRDKGGINYDLNAAGQRNEEREHFMLFNMLRIVLEILISAI